MSPEEIRPYPKALPRKQTGKGRPKGKSLILNDTPKKERIEAQKLEQTLKGQKRPKSKNVKKKLAYLSSSESDVDDPETVCDDLGLQKKILPIWRIPPMLTLMLEAFFL